MPVEWRCNWVECRDGDTSIPIFAFGPDERQLGSVFPTVSRKIYMYAFARLWLHMHMKLRLKLLAFDGSIA